MRIANIRLQPALMLLGSCFLSAQVYAAGEVRQVGTSTVPATPFRYTAAGTTHTWGAGENQLIESFSTDHNTFRFASLANRVELARDDIAGVSTGVPCGVFAERAGPSASLLAADFPNDAAGTGNCDMAAMLASRVVNRGALDLFSNDGPTPKNVERIDYVFDAGLFAPLSADALNFGGHLVAEKRGNNRLQIAAILSLDAFGQPMEFGPLVRVNEFFFHDASQVRYGETNLRHNYSFFQSNSISPQAFPVFLQDSTETVAMAFVSANDLGLHVGQVYHGFSYFGDDVDSNVHVLTDVSTFPNNTADNNILPGDGADVYGGVSGMFVSDSISVGTGAVFLDENGNGIQDANEAGINDVTVTLVEDTNQNGIVDDGDTQLGQIDSGANGEIVLPGLPNGTFILQVDPNDPNFPGGTAVPADESTVVIVVNNDDPSNINFGVSDSVSDDGSGDGAGDDGAGDGNGNGDGAGDNGAGDGNGDGAGDDGAGNGGGAGDNGAGNGDGAGDNGAGNGDGAGDNGAGNGDGAGDNGDVGGPDNPNDGSPPTDETGSNGEGTDTVPESSTAAVADTVEVNQGETVTIDVLANDIDGPGQGLTIVSVEGTGNGTVSIVNGQVVYTPNAGFVGMDTLTYTVVDADGIESTGTITVEVIETSTEDNADGEGNGNDNGADNIPASMTDVVPDSAEVNQGDSVTIDVLSNDIDGPGQGLTIVSVEGTGNGTVAIVDGPAGQQQIVYTPNAGFFGLDNLVYTVVDAEGVESSGTISVEVIRFSDINNNGENDFVECDCSSLQLETGIHGSGIGGGVAHWSLLMLLAFIGMLRIQARSIRQRIFWSA